MNKKLPKTAFKKGTIPWNKGLKKSSDKRLNGGRPLGGTPWNKGKKTGYNKKQADKIRGKKQTKESIEKRIAHFSGKNSHFWKGGKMKDKKYQRWRKRQCEIKRRNLLKIAGSHTFGEWENLKKQYDFTCPCCNKQEPEIKLTEDHIVPVSRGGSNNIENIQPLCVSCNSKKNTKIIYYGDISD